MGAMLDRVVSVGCGILLLGIVVYASFKVVPMFSRVRELDRQRQQVLAEIEQKNREIAQLRENQRRFREDPDFVEAIARQNRRVFPGEIVFVFEK